MKATLIVDGKEFPIEILDKELQKLISGKKNTGYERVNGERFYCIGEDGDVESYKDTSVCYDSIYQAANYYSSKELAENHARADKLMRQLRRFAVEHRENNLTWKKNSTQCKYYIYYDYDDEEFRNAFITFTRHFGGIYFYSAEAANKAIEIYHDELIWYFTEYKDSL